MAVQTIFEKPQLLLSSIFWKQKISFTTVFCPLFPFVIVGIQKHFKYYNFTVQVFTSFFWREWFTNSMSFFKYLKWFKHFETVYAILPTNELDRNFESKKVSAKLC